MPDTVVITRPLAQAAAFAQQVAALGRQPCVLPLLEIAPLPDPAALIAALADLPHYTLVAFVSPNAIDAALRHVPAWPPQVALAVLGEGSRAALAAHGITPAQAAIHSPADGARSDSETLLEALGSLDLRARRVLIVRGEGGRELLADGLRALGAHVTQVAAYRRSVPPLTPQLAATLRRLLNQNNDWILTSSEALRGLVGLLSLLDTLDGPAVPADGNANGDSFVVRMQRQHLIVPHERIAQTATALGFHCLTLTGSGDERLLAALQSRL